MPTATKSQTTRRPRTRQPNPVPAPEQPALLDDGRERINGLLVVETHRMQNLPNTPMNLIKFTLEDGSAVYGCVDCPDELGTRDEVRLHRNRVHKTPKDVVGRKDSPILQMSLAQIISAVESSLAAGTLVERLEAERDRFREERDVILQKYTKLVRALDRVGFTPKMEDDD